MQLLSIKLCTLLFLFALGAGYLAADCRYGNTGGYNQGEWSTGDTDCYDNIYPDCTYGYQVCEVDYCYSGNCTTNNNYPDNWGKIGYCVTLNYCGLYNPCNPCP